MTTYPRANRLLQSRHEYGFSPVSIRVSVVRKGSRCLPCIHGMPAAVLHCASPAWAILRVLSCRFRCSVLEKLASQYEHPLRDMSGENEPVERRRASWPEWNAHGEVYGKRVLFCPSFGFVVSVFWHVVAPRPPPSVYLVLLIACIVLSLSIFDLDKGSLPSASPHMLASTLCQKTISSTWVPHLPLHHLATVQYTLP